MKRKEPLLVTVEDINLKGLWEKLCEVLSWSITAQEDGLVHSGTVIELTPEQAKQLNL